VDTLLHLGLSNALAATVLALVAAGLGSACRRPALAHGLWLLVLLKLLTPPLLLIPVPWPARTASAPAAPNAAPLPVPLARPPDPVGLFAPDPEPVPAAPAGDPAADPRAEAAVESAGVAPVPEPARAAIPPGLSWQQVIGAFWLTGSLLWVTVAGVRLSRFQRLLRYTEPAPAPVQEQARRLAARLGVRRCPGVWFLAAPVSPLLWALGRTPRLLVPAGLWQRLTEEQRDTLLAHELAHLRRRDHWVRALELVALAVYWWHPVVWWARRELREAEEQCCDAWVVWALPAAAPTYATALLAAVAFLSQARPTLPAAASGIGHVSHVKRRLTMILRGTPSRTLSPGGLLVVLGLGLLLLPLVPTWAQPREEPKAPGTDKKAAEPIADPPPVAAKAAERAAEPPPAAESAVAPSPEDTARKTSADRERAEEIERARDEVELLEVQLRIKQAELQAVRTGVNQAHDRLARIKDLQTRGVVSSEALEKARAEVATLEAQLLIKDAELKEPMVRLKQAQRRLDRLQRPAEGPTPPTRRDPLPEVKKPRGGQPADENRRLSELEKKLDLLLKEVESLRRELRPKRPGEEKPKDEPTEVPVMKMNTRHFSIPIHVDRARRGSIKEVTLYSSTDAGRTWQQVATATPDRGAFNFYAPADGLYWFTVGTVDNEGRRAPVDLSGARPVVKVLVDTRN
jgi:beta-lactamase regulating signal transducer with metallopeptidase domain